LRYLYHYDDLSEVQSTQIDGILTTLTPLGAWFGTIIVAYIGQLYSAMNIIMIGNIFTILGTIMTLFFNVHFDYKYGSLILFGTGRFVIGIGIGSSVSIVT